MKKNLSSGAGLGTARPTAMLEGIPATRTVLYLRSRRILSTLTRSIRPARVSRYKTPNGPSWRVVIFWRRGQVDTWPSPATVRWSSIDCPILFLETLKRLKDGSLIGKTRSGNYWLFASQGR